MTVIAKKTNGSAKDILRFRSTLKLLNYQKSTVQDQSGNMSCHITNRKFHIESL